MDWLYERLIILALISRFYYRALWHFHFIVIDVKLIVHQQYSVVGMLNIVATVFKSSVVVLLTISMLHYFFVTRYTMTTYNYDKCYYYL